MLTAINLSLSSACGGNCIFCPEDRGRGIAQKIMPFEYVEKIVNEIASPEFKQEHKITEFSVGENGDAFLNKDLIKILRFIKEKLPEVKVSITINFQHSTADKIETILREKLIDSFSCNMDGANAANYYNVKKLDYDNFIKNLISFLDYRKRLNYFPPLTVSVLTLSRYIKTIKNNFGFYPSKLKNLELVKVADDYLIIKAKLESMLNLEVDKIFKVGIFGWAEREQIDTKKINYKKYNCRNINRIETEAFIAPDGTWYACCFDANNVLVWGNVIKESISQVFDSQKRQQLIQRLKNKQFAEIGGPCQTVNCCQYLPETKMEKKLMPFNKLKRKILYKINSYLPKIKKYD